MVSACLVHPYHSDPIEHVTGNEAPAVSIHALYDMDCKDPHHSDARVSSNGCTSHWKFYTSIISGWKSSLKAALDQIHNIYSRSHLQLVLITWRFICTLMVASWVPVILEKPPSLVWKARFRVYGDVSPVHPLAITSFDLAHVFAGGRVLSVSDQHYGIGSNLILPGRGKNMGDGWETKRSRTKGHKDWAVIQL